MREITDPTKKAQEQKKFALKQKLAEPEQDGLSMASQIDGMMRSMDNDKTHKARALTPIEISVHLGRIDHGLNRKGGGYNKCVKSLSAITMAIDFLRQANSKKNIKIVKLISRIRQLEENIEMGSPSETYQGICFGCGHEVVRGDMEECFMCGEWRCHSCMTGIPGGRMCPECMDDEMEQL